MHGRREWLGRDRDSCSQGWIRMAATPIGKPIHVVRRWKRAGLETKATRRTKTTQRKGTWRERHGCPLLTKIDDTTGLANGQLGFGEDR